MIPRLTTSSTLRGSTARNQQSRQLGAIALIGLIPLLLVYFLYTRHESSAASTAQRNLVTAQANLASVQNLVASAAAGGKSAITALEQGVKTAKSLLPTSVSQQIILTTVPNETASAGLTLSNLSAGTSAPGPIAGLSMIPVTVTVTGSLSGITSWVTTVQSSTPLVTIANPSLTGSGRSSGSYQLSATLDYWYTTVTPSNSST